VRKGDRPKTSTQLIGSASRRCAGNSKKGIISSARARAACGGLVLGAAGDGYAGVREEKESTSAKNTASCEP